MVNCWGPRLGRNRDQAYHRLCMNREQACPKWLYENGEWLYRGRHVGLIWNMSNVDPFCLCRCRVGSKTESLESRLASLIT